MAEVLSQVALSNLSLDRLPERQGASKLIMCKPQFYEVKDVKNSFMAGKVGAVDVEKAAKQWAALKETCEMVGYSVEVLDPVEGLEDMVFAANQGFVGMDGDGPYIVAGLMKYESRRREVPYYLEWFRNHGYRVLELPSSGSAGERLFEGHGDAVWHPGRRLVWGGFGARTTECAYPALSALLDVPVVTLRLADERFYHLDTCFCALDERSVLIYRGAFDDAGLAAITSLFENVISVPLADALNFACNALAFRGNVIIQKGSASTVRLLEQHGFRVYEVDTSEFMKGGGSVFCLKCEIY